MNVVIISIADVKLHIIAKKLYIPVSGVLLLLRQRPAVVGASMSIGDAALERMLPSLEVLGFFQVIMISYHKTLELSIDILNDAFVALLDYLKDPGAVIPSLP